LLVVVAVGCGCVQKRGGFRPIKCCLLITVAVYGKEEVSKEANNLKVNKLSSRLLLRLTA
jgi:hypothetical protein